MRCVGAVVLMVLCAHVRAKGWEKHVAEVQGVYSRRRDWMLGFCERYLKDNASWTAPSAGAPPRLPVRVVIFTLWWWQECFSG